MIQSLNHTRDTMVLKMTSMNGICAYYSFFHLSPETHNYSSFVKLKETELQNQTQRRPLVIMVP
jgi:hypothetical protein